MASREEVEARVRDMPEFAFRIGRSEIPHGPSRVFSGGEDHEADLATRTGRALQHKYPKRLDDSVRFSPKELREAMASVAYVPMTKAIEDIVRQILDHYWDYWYLLPR